ncbi:hypothetical protein A4U53_031160 [Rhizobium ruizarguesonis]|uniref:Uncharacterized protein n=1 Tax=Rhizobium ruizarguesonis TaxID=2081791 RepID=A0ACD5EMS3_9HYPH
MRSDGRPKPIEDQAGRRHCRLAVRPAPPEGASERQGPRLWGPGPRFILEGFVCRRSDVERAIEIAESVVGRGYVRSRLLRR